MTKKQKSIVLNLIQNLPDTEEYTETSDALLQLLAENSRAMAHKTPPVENEKKLQFLKFTKQEIDSMPNSIQQILLIYNGYAVPYEKYKNSLRARYRRDGYVIEVYGKTVEILKAKFLDRLTNYKPKVKIDTSIPFFKDFVAEWIKLKELSVKTSTLESYNKLLSLHLLPTFGEKRLQTITRVDVQDFLTALVKEGKNRTASKLKQLLSAIFDVAVEDYNFKSPMTKIVLPHYEVKKGNALTKAEEKHLINFCIEKNHLAGADAILVLLYTGMRIGELKTAVYHDTYVKCETEKTRKGYAREFRKIPITPMYRKVMQYINFDKAVRASKENVKDAMDKAFKGKKHHHPHELRYTFITRCKEAGCNFELIMLWDGHKFDKDVRTSAVDRGYTDYSEEYYFSESEKVNYEL